VGINPPTPGLCPVTLTQKSGQDSPHFHSTGNVGEPYKLHKEGSQTVTNCNQLKMVAEDGRLRLTENPEPVRPHERG
jgi:hypothetical protein